MSSTPTRTVSLEAARNVLSMVHAGELTEEQAYRLLFPEEAAGVYSLDRWPYGPPLPGRLGAGKGSTRQW